VLLYFLHHNYTVHSAKKGMISIDLIEPVRHSPPPQPTGPGIAKPTFRVATPAPQPQPESAQTPDAARTSPEMEVYILAVLKEIAKRKTYPLDSLDRGEEGKVVIGVSVESSGQVLEVRVEEPSAFARLNRAAVETVKGIQALPPVPSSLATPVHLHIPLVYRIENH
jgi:TonB family protein